MTDHEQTTGWLNGWRIAGWGALLALLALPAIGMALTDEVEWTARDFVFAAVLLGALGGGVELAFRLGRNAPQRLAIALFALTAFLTLWANMAVGFIGHESEPVNAGFTILAVVGPLVALLVRFRATIMRWVAAFIALAQPALGIAALTLMPGHQVEWGVLAFFALLWGSSAILFHRAAPAT